MIMHLQATTKTKQNKTKQLNLLQATIVFLNQSFQA